MEDFVSNKMTRRDFLKMLGGSALFGGLALTGFGTLSNLGKNTGSRQQRVAFADAGGSWQLGPNTLYTAIHAALLSNGKIFYMAGSDFTSNNANGPFTAALLDPVTNTQVDIPLSEDLFCCGMTQLPNGNLLLAGGTMSYPDKSPNGFWHGLNIAYEFDITSQSLVKVQSMAHGRWYPTLVSLDENSVACFSGFDEYGCSNHLMEIYNRSSKTWSISYDPTSNSTYCVGFCTTLPGAGSPCYGGNGRGMSPDMFMYPRMHLMPSGLLAVVGMSNVMRTWNPVNNTWVTAGIMTDAIIRYYGTSVLLPLQNNTTEQGKILVAGGSPSTSILGQAMNSCLIITPDGSKLNYRFTASMTYPRLYLNPVILPDGKVVVFGGSTSQNIVANAVYTPEMFDPNTETWTSLNPSTIPRLYHSVALLLPDGRVWNAGTSPHELRTDIFSPAYVSATRPTISGDVVISGGYGGSITINTPDAADITSVSLVKISSITHFYSTDQRLIWLQIQSKGSNSVTVAAPVNSKLAPPGYYLIHVLDSNSVPSIGKFIRIQS